MTGVDAIPVDWVIRTLDDVSVRIQDGTHFSPTLGGSEYRYVTSRNIGSGRLRLDSVEMISRAEHRKIYRRCDTRFGDLLLTKDGANTGNAAMNSFTDEISLLSSVAFIRADRRRATEEYLLQYLLSGAGRKQIEDAMAGNAITRLTLAKIKGLRVPMPSVEEQRQIGAALAEADDLIATLERLIAKKQAIKQGMMQQLLTGKTYLPGFTDQWADVRLGDHVSYVKTVRLADVTTRIGSGITPRGGSSVYKTAGRPFVRSQNVGWGDLRVDDLAYIDDATHMTFPATEIRRGDVLLNITGASIGRSAVATPDLDGGNVNQHVCEIRVKRNVMDPDFLNAFLISRAGQDQIDRFQAGGNRQGLNFQQVGSIEVPRIDYARQGAVGRASRDVDDLIRALDARLSKARAVKTGMMQQLLTGRTRLPVEAAS